MTGLTLASLFAAFMVGVITGAALAVATHAIVRGPSRLKREARMARRYSR
jgi:hypothetical protein